MLLQNVLYTILKVNVCLILAGDRQYKPQSWLENFQHPNTLLFSFHVVICLVVVKMAMDRAERIMPTNSVANIVSFFMELSFRFV